MGRVQAYLSTNVKERISIKFIISGFQSVKTRKKQISTGNTSLPCLRINLSQATSLKPLGVANACVVLSKTSFTRLQINLSKLLAVNVCKMSSRRGRRLYLFQAVSRRLQDDLCFMGPCIPRGVISPNYGASRILAGKTGFIDNGANTALDV